jgi:polyribonucleotide nucleotidyltransferase
MKPFERPNLRSSNRWAKKWWNGGEKISAILGDLQKQICRDMILKEGRRIDNRKFDEIRPITCEVAFSHDPMEARCSPVAKPRFSVS